MAGGNRECCPRLWGPVREQIEADASKDDVGQKVSLLDSRHFGYIVRQHQSTAFAGAFANPMRAFDQFRRLTTVRNEWAHVQEISIGRFRQAATIMQDILAALNCEEALQVEKVRAEAVTESTPSGTDEHIEAADLEKQSTEAGQVLAEPLDSWRQLQTYLQVDRIVTFSEEGGQSRATINVKVSNTAPSGPGWPTVIFTDVSVSNVRSRTGKLFDVLLPGQSDTTSFETSANRLLTFELEISAQIDGAALLRFKQDTGVSNEVTAEIKKRFLDEFEAIGVKSLVTDAVETVGLANEDLKMSEAAQLRESTRGFSGRAEEATKELGPSFEVIWI